MFCHLPANPNIAKRAIRSQQNHFIGTGQKLVDVQGKVSHCKMLVGSANTIPSCGGFHLIKEMGKGGAVKKGPKPLACQIVKVSKSPPDFLVLLMYQP